MKEQMNGCIRRLAFCFDARGGAGRKTILGCGKNCSTTRLTSVRSLSSGTTTTASSSSDKPPAVVVSSNPRLKGIIDGGIGKLKEGTTIIQRKEATKKPLFPKSSREDDEERRSRSAEQLIEANRMLTVAQECLEGMYQRKKKHPFSIGGYPILLLHAEVNANLRECTLYWSLPFELLDLDEERQVALLGKFQSSLESGLGKLLQGEIHKVLSAYYPPKVKFKPASRLLLDRIINGEEEDF